MTWKRGIRHFAKRKRRFPVHQDGLQRNWVCNAVLEIDVILAAITNGDDEISAATKIVLKGTRAPPFCSPTTINRRIVKLVKTAHAFLLIFHLFERFSCSPECDIEFMAHTHIARRIHKQRLFAAKFSDVRFPSHDLAFPASSQALLATQSWYAMIGMVCREVVGISWGRHGFRVPLQSARYFQICFDSDNGFCLGWNYTHKRPFPPLKKTWAFGWERSEAKTIPDRCTELIINRIRIQSNCRGTRLERGASDEETTRRRKIMSVKC